tara:strand:- start:514 stop:1497 length:984 start_codon:yes stop_codon:yes gene_type:complete
MNKKNLKNVLIYGCGNIGSRHAQGALKVDNKINLFLYDINKKSVRLCKDRIKKIKKNNNINSINFLENFSIFKKFDIVILATTAKNRYNLIKEITNKINIKFLIIEKVPFQSFDHFYKAIKILNKKKIKSWVNCPNRIYRSYNNLKKIIKIKKNIHMKVTGGNWGLASNFIHYLDLFSFLINETKINIIYHKLNQPFESKRKNFIEFDGSILVKSKNNNYLFVEDDIKFNKPVVIEISGYYFKIIIFESLNKAIFFHKEDKWKKKEISFIIEKQSKLTKYMIEDILEKKDCKLINLNQSFSLNENMFKIFKNHYNKFNKKSKLIPIT